MSEKRELSGGEILVTALVAIVLLGAASWMFGNVVERLRCVEIAVYHQPPQAACKRYSNTGKPE